MHEMGIMSGVLDSVNAAANNAGATRVTKIILNIGDMTEIIQDSLEFAFEIMSEGTPCEGAELVIKTVTPRSLCLDCGQEFDHDRFHRTCTHCGSYSTTIIRGRELDIESIEVDLPDEGEEPAVEGEAPGAGFAAEPCADRLAGAAQTAEPADEPQPAEPSLGA